MLYSSPKFYLLHIYHIQYISNIYLSKLYLYLYFFQKSVSISIILLQKYIFILLSQKCIHIYTSFTKMYIYLYFFHMNVSISNNQISFSFKSTVCKLYVFNQFSLFYKFSENSFLHTSSFVFLAIKGISCILLQIVTSLLLLIFV